MHAAEVICDQRSVDIDGQACRGYEIFVVLYQLMDISIDISMDLAMDIHILSTAQSSNCYTYIGFNRMYSVSCCKVGLLIL